MRIEKTVDRELIKKLWSDPRLFDSMKDDWPLTPEEWEPIFQPGTVEWLTFIDDNDECVGALMIVRKNYITWELHVGFHSSVWGTPIPSKFVKTLIPAAFEVTDAKKLVANIPVPAEPVWKFAKRCGMKIEGTAKKAYLKNGERQDLYYLGVYR